MEREVESALVSTNEIIAIGRLFVLCARTDKERLIWIPCSDSTIFPERSNELKVTDRDTGPRAVGYSLNFLDTFLYETRGVNRNEPRYRRHFRRRRRVQFRINLPQTPWPANWHVNCSRRCSCNHPFVRVVLFTVPPPTTHLSPTNAPGNTTGIIETTDLYPTMETAAGFATRCRGKVCVTR